MEAGRQLAQQGQRQRESQWGGTPPLLQGVPAPGVLQGAPGAGPLLGPAQDRRMSVHTLFRKKVCVHGPCQAQDAHVKGTFSFQASGAHAPSKALHLTAVPIPRPTARPHSSEHSCEI